MYIKVVSERVISTTFFVASLLLYHHLSSSKIMQLSLLWYLIMGVFVLQWRFWAKQVVLQWRFWAKQEVLQWSFWAQQGPKVPSGGAVYYFEDWRTVEDLWLRLKVHFFLHWTYLLYVVILHFICVPTCLSLECLSLHQKCTDPMYSRKKRNPQIVLSCLGDDWCVSMCT
jgi:hypothetical protein